MFPIGLAPGVLVRGLLDGILHPSKKHHAKTINITPMIVMFTDIFYDTLNFRNYYILGKPEEERI
jgi:hypothetical protein